MKIKIGQTRVKSILAIFLSIVLCFTGLVGCGNEKKEEPSGQQTQGSDGEEEKPQEEPEATTWEDIDLEDEYLFLVNKTHPIDEDYKASDLTDVKYYAKDRDASTRYMRKKVTEAFHQLVEGAQAEGHEIIMTTAYRSYGFQGILYNNYVKKYGQTEADKFSAKPGTSEHQTGLCTDVSSPSVNYQLTTEYGETDEGKWLEEHAHEYGFILRFPKGKEEITGYQYEPWHIRYVGQPAADRIYENGLTLEEYLGVLD